MNKIHFRYLSCALRLVFGIFDKVEYTLHSIEQVYLN